LLSGPGPARRFISAAVRWFELGLQRFGWFWLDFRLAAALLLIDKPRNDSWAAEGLLSGPGTARRFVSADLR